MKNANFVWKKKYFVSESIVRCDDYFKVAKKEGKKRTEGRHQCDVNFSNFTIRKFDEKAQTNSRTTPNDHTV